LLPSFRPSHAFMTTSDIDWTPDSVNKMSENPDNRGHPDNREQTALPPDLRYIQYEHALEKQYLPSIRALISKDLSEPYSIYVYRYFLYQWGDLCFMVTFILALILEIS